jgi:hypothetical protein
MPATSFDDAIGRNREAVARFATLVTSLSRRMGASRRPGLAFGALGLLEYVLFNDLHTRHRTARTLARAAS